VTLVIKKYPDSKVGARLHDLKEGDAVEMKGPNQQWKLDLDHAVTNYAMIAGGTGITPLIQAAKHILDNHEGAKVTLITFNKTNKDILLRQELGALRRQHRGRFMVKHVIESGEKFHILLEGSPNEELLGQLLPAPDAEGGVLVMVCGRPPMTAAVAGPKAKDYTQGELGGILKSLGFSSSQVWKV